jgi:hypothetical protein
MNLIRALIALVVRALESGVRRSCARCQNGRRVFRLPIWQKCNCSDFDARLRYLTKSPQKTRSSAGSRDALLRKNTALLMRYFRTTSRIPERRAPAILAGFALLQEFGRVLLDLLALLRENRGVLHDFRAGACRPDSRYGRSPDRATCADRRSPRTSRGVIWRGDLRSASRRGQETCAERPELGRLAISGSFGRFTIHDSRPDLRFVSRTRRILMIFPRPSPLPTPSQSNLV